MGSCHRSVLRGFLPLIVILGLTTPGWSSDPIDLIPAEKPLTVWNFDNGREFPGAAGSLTAEPGANGTKQPILKLTGDFRKGGAYVQTGRKLDGVDIETLSLQVRNPGRDRFTLRLTDSGRKTHQFDLKTEPHDQWQTIDFPLARFFANRGQSDAVTTVARYQSWGEGKDSDWHGPATGIYILVGKPGGVTKVRTLEIREVRVVPPLKLIPGADVTSTVRLDEIADGEHDWAVSLGGEVPGAKGTLTAVTDPKGARPSHLRLAADFTGGGAYVAAIKHLTGLDAKDVPAIRMQVRSPNVQTVTIQVVDKTGQTHQRKGVKVAADGKWHEFTIVPKEIAGGEHWGGAKDGKWHGPPTRVVVSVTSGSDRDGRRPVLDLADIRAEVVRATFLRPPAFETTFAGAKLPQGWISEGDVSIDPKPGAKDAALLLSRTLDRVNEPCTATSPTFPVAPGTWEVRLATRSDLTSPDNSYSGVVRLDGLDPAGKVVRSFTVADVFGRKDWAPIRGQFQVPDGVSSARFQVVLNKTHGRFWVNGLSASLVTQATTADDRVTRMMFSTPALGNLFLPTDPRTVTVTIEAIKPLPDDQKTLTYVLRDYWGAEQTRPATVTMGRAIREGAKLSYEATIDLSSVPLELGRYYEIHASLPRPGGEPFLDRSSFAILPEAETKKYKPADVPFLSRNWDNRITEYIRLTDRLGLRMCGLWGGWSATPPYKARAPGLDLVHELGMGWVTTTPAANIERGKRDYDEKALREGVRNLIKNFGHVRPLYICLGNEPHGTGQKVLDNVAAYKAIYEVVKETDPSITVVATSVEPNEEYFKAGYGKWCDVYDFHIYEDPENVRRTMAEYRALAKKYGQEKPIWSTELGLNSQGMTRLAVASEVSKKFAVFFAGGGEKVSWFGLLYPDPDGTSSGSSGDSHNVFDCRYRRYAPRLDAIAYYNAVNAIAVKKFVAETKYDNGVRAFLFRDSAGRMLQILWSDGDPQDVTIPLSEVQTVQTIRIDGTRRELDAAGVGVTLTIGKEPLLLLYQGGPTKLPDTLGAPAATFGAVPKSLAPEKPWSLSVSNGDSQSIKNVELLPPKLWTVAKKSSASSTSFELTPPVGTAVREVDVTATLTDANGRLRGELNRRVPVSR